MKYTKLERNWVMYDVGNSALVLLNTSVVPIYFNAINTGASSADWWSLGATRRRLPRWSLPCSCPFWARLPITPAQDQVLLGLLPHGPGSLPGAGYPNVRHGIFDCVRAVHHRPQLFYDVLRRHAARHYHRRAHGRRVQLGLCLGLHRFHRAVHHLPGAYHGWSRSWCPHHAGNASVVCHHWCLVAHLYPAAHSHL